MNSEISTVPTTTTYLFEDKLSATLFSRWHPEATVYDLPSWSATMTGTAVASPESRLSLFQSFFKSEPEKAQPTLATIESLREALILNEEDVEFCFSALAPTPKNKALKKAYLSYLESPLSLDWAHQLWTIIESLKNFQPLSLGFSGDLVLVRALNTSYLFQELESALKGSPQVGSVFLKESWELADAHTGTPEKPGVVAFGSAPTSLFKLAEHAAKWLERFPNPEKLHFSFHGSAQMKDYLGHALHHFGINYQEEVPPPSATSPQGETLAELLQNLRSDKTLELKTRLKLTSILWEDPLGRRPNEPWPQYFEKLERLKKIQPDDKIYLQRLVESKVEIAPPPLRNPNQVTLLPFCYPPLAKGHAVLAYAAETVLDPPPSFQLLRPGEREQLHLAGFSVQRPGAHRERHLQLLQAFATPNISHRIFCTSLPLEQFPEGVTPRVLPERDFQAKQTSDSTWVPLPAKPLSATQLETYARCPTQYFFSQRLRLQRSDAPEAKYPLLFGQATHLALENFFQDSDLKTNEAHESEALLLKHFANALNEIAPSLDPGHPLHVIMTEHFRKFAKKVPALEKALQEIVGKSEVIAFEKPFEIIVEGVKLRGKIDRIDKTSNGEVLVLDYKTGTVDFTPNHIVQGEHFQALLYLLAADQLFDNKKSGLLFYDLKKGEVRRGILLEDSINHDSKKKVTRGHVLTPSKYEEIKEKGIEQLKRLAQGIGSGDYSPRPHPQVCERCDYVGVCRKGTGYA